MVCSYSRQNNIYLIELLSELHEKTKQQSLAQRISQKMTAICIICQDILHSTLYICAQLKWFLYLFFEDEKAKYLVYKGKLFC